MSFQTVFCWSPMDSGLSSLRCYSPLWKKAQDATYRAQQLDNSIDLNGDSISSTLTFKFISKLGKHHFQSSLRFTQQMEP